MYRSIQKQKTTKEIINRPARFRACPNLAETPRASFLANYANILNIGQQTKKERIAITANRHYLPALAYLLPTIRRPQSPQPSMLAESFSPTKYIFSDKKQFYSIPRNLHFDHRCSTFFPPLTTLPKRTSDVFAPYLLRIKVPKSEGRTKKERRRYGANGSVEGVRGGKRTGKAHR